MSKYQKKCDHEWSDYTCYQVPDNISDIKEINEDDKFQICVKCGIHQPGDDVLRELLDDVDGSDIERVVNELIARGGTDEILGYFLRDKVIEFFAQVDPESVVTE